MPALYHITLPKGCRRKLWLLLALILATLCTIPVVVVATAGALSPCLASAFIPCRLLAPASVAIATSVPISIDAVTPAA